MLSRTDQYALQVLAHLACHPEKRMQGKELAEATGISWSYLSKILSTLRKKGFVSAEKGWGGGFKITKSAYNKSIFSVMEAVGDSKLIFSSCLFGWPKCGDKKPCPLHQDWKKISEAVTKVLKGTTIAALGCKLGR